MAAPVWQVTLRHPSFYDFAPLELASVFLPLKAVDTLARQPLFGRDGIANWKDSYRVPNGDLFVGVWPTPPFETASAPAKRLKRLGSDWLL